MSAGCKRGAGAGRGGEASHWDCRGRSEGEAAEGRGRGASWLRAAVMVRSRASMAHWRTCRAEERGRTEQGGEIT